MPPKKEPSDLSRFLESTNRFIHQALKELMQLIKEFDEEKQNEPEASPISRSAIVLQRTEELKAKYKNLILKQASFKEKGTKKDVKFAEQIEQSFVEVQNLHNANKAIMWIMVNLQQLWNRYYITIPQHGAIQVLYELVQDILAILEAEEQSRKFEISDAFTDLCGQATRHLEAICQLLNSLTIADGAIFEYLSANIAKPEEQSGVIKADGNCMYRAVVVALVDEVGNDLLLGTNEDERMQYLRRIVAARVREMYEAGVDANNAVVFNNAIATARRHHDFEGDEEEAVDFYIDTIIATPGPYNWGDHTVLQIIADVLRIIIRVHQAETGAVITITPMQEAVEDDYPMIQLLHHGEVHYEVHRENGYDNMPALVANEVNDEIATYADVHVGNNTHVPQEAEDDLSFLMGSSAHSVIR